MQKQAWAFDTSALHQLRPEVSAVSSQLERHLSQYADDLESTAELADAQLISTQLAKVMNLIELEGTDLLLHEVTYGLKKLEENAPQPMTQLVLAISMGMMLFSRYLDFVLLKNLQSPSLLLGSVNQIRRASGRALHPVDGLLPQGNPPEFTSIQWPASQALALKKSVSVLINPYAGSDKKTRAWQYLGRIAQRIDEHQPNPFYAGFAQLAEQLEQRPVLLYVQQFLSALEALPRASSEHKKQLHDNLFALLATLEQDGSEPCFYDTWVRHEYFIYGPDRDAITTINDLIQSELSELKGDIDQLAHDKEFDLQQHTNCSKRLRSIALRLYIMGLSRAAHAVMNQAKLLSQWKGPGSAEQFDELMSCILISENAASMMAIEHTPGAMKPPLNNTKISLHKLRVAYELLIDESRACLERVQEVITSYAGSANRTSDMLQSLTEELRSVSGALLFLEVQNGNKLLNHLARYLRTQINHNQDFSDEQLDRLADIVSSVDYFLESLKTGRPTGQKPLVRGAQSLKSLLAA